MVLLSVAVVCSACEFSLYQTYAESLIQTNVVVHVFHYVKFEL
jgi:hypothetical protein